MGLLRIKKMTYKLRINHNDFWIEIEDNNYMYLTLLADQFYENDLNNEDMDIIIYGVINNDIL